jgi:hypothetical protein
MEETRHVGSGSGRGAQGALNAALLAAARGCG